MRCAFLQDWSFGVFTTVLVVVAVEGFQRLEDASDGACDVEEDDGAPGEALLVEARGVVQELELLLQRGLARLGLAEEQELDTVISASDHGTPARWLTHATP